MMSNKKCWAEKFNQALDNKDSQERYAIETNWLNDFKSQLMILIEVYDFEMDEGDILLAQENKFDNSKLIKEGDYEDRTNLINKMKELNKDSIKTMQDYFMINPSLSVNKDFSLINGEAYDMLIQQNYGGPNIRFFVDDIESDTDLNDKVITSFMEGSDSLKENQYIDLDTMQLGIVIKLKDKTIIEVGYYPKKKSLTHILKVITKRMNIDYTQMAVDLRKSSTEVRKDSSSNSDLIDEDKKILADGTDEEFFYLENTNQQQGQQQSNKSLSELGIQQNQIIIFTDQYNAIQVLEQDDICFDGADLLNFTEQGFQNQGMNFQNDFNNQDFYKNLSGQKNKSASEKRNADFMNSNMYINTARRNNFMDNYMPHNNQCTNPTLESTYDSPTQVHNNSVQYVGIDDEGDEENENLIDSNKGGNYPHKRNILKRNKHSDDSTEENDADDEDMNFNQAGKGSNGMNRNNQPQIPFQIIGQAKSQEEIDQINQEIKNAIGRNGSLVLQKLTNQQIVQNMIQMINQTQLTIQEQLQQRAKQEKNIFQAQQLEKLRFKDFSDQKGDDSERTSSTSTQPDNIKKKKRKVSNNLLFDENICDAEDLSQFIN